MLVKKASSFDFWWIYEKMVDDNSEFIANKEFILDSFTKGCMFIQYDKAMLLPAFCILNTTHEICQIIWVHTQSRRQGVGTNFFKQLNFEKTSSKTELGQLFFAKLQLKYTNYNLSTERQFHG